MPLSYTTQDIEKIVGAAGIPLAGDPPKAYPLPPGHPPGPIHAIRFPSVAADTMLVSGFYALNLLKYLINYKDKTKVASELRIGHTVFDKAGNHTAVTFKLNLELDKIEALQKLIATSPPGTTPEDLLKNSDILDALKEFYKKPAPTEPKILEVNADCTDTINKAFMDFGRDAPKPKPISILFPCDVNTKQILAVEELCNFFDKGTHLAPSDDKATIEKYSRTHEKLLADAAVTATKSDPSSGSLATGHARANIKAYCLANDLQMTQVAGKNEHTIQSTQKGDDQAKPFLLDQNKMTFQTDNLSDEQVTRLSKKFIATFLIANYKGKDIDGLIKALTEEPPNKATLAKFSKDLEYPSLKATKTTDASTKAITAMKTFLDDCGIKPKLTPASKPSTTPTLDDDKSEEFEHKGKPMGRGT